MNIAVKRRVLDYMKAQRWYPDQEELRKQKAITRDKETTCMGQSNFDEIPKN